ncbi:MAG TPA: alpha/beta fold hydrolase [Candidatus Binataceae bacterium]|nr:alpha/beta fold hydrolase [Candidatus Binataceae bacterium]
MLPAAWPVFADAATFASAGIAQAIPGTAGIHEWSYLATVGKSPFDKIGLHRLDKGSAPPAHPAAVVLYLPGTNMNGEIALDDPRYSFQVYLATRGIDVWSMDYRTHFIPPSTPESDLSELTGWTNDLFISDIDTAAKFIGAQTGQAKIFIAGFSRGGEFAYMFAAMHPERVAGLVILDGYIPVVALESEPLPPGKYAVDIGGKHLTYEKRKALMQMVIDNPNQPAPIPKYKTAGENLEHVLYDADGFFGGHGGLANPQGGHSNVSVLARLLIGYDRYWPAIQDHEYPFTLARLAALKATKVPVIAFASTNMGRIWTEGGEAAAHVTGAPAAEVSFTKFDGWGHLDVLAGTDSEKRVFAPTAKFIMRQRR